MGTIDDAIDRGDVGAIVRAGIGAMRAEAEGRYCQCPQPDLTGRKSYICFACDLPNMTRKREIEAALVAPHPFEPNERLHPLLIDLCCDFCAAARTSPRHRAEVRPAAQEGRDE